MAAFMAPHSGRRSRCTVARHSAVSENGFSVLEVLIALTILLIVLVPVAGLLATSFSVGSNSRLKQEATGMATSALDNQLQSGATALLADMGESSLGTTTPTGGNQVFTIEREVSTYTPGSTACVSPQSNAEAMLEVTIFVTWSHVTSGSQWWSSSDPSYTGNLVSVSSSLALPPTALNANDGSILVDVTGAKSEPEQGVSVTASSDSQTVTVTTTSAGCALFANLAPGNWTVTASRTGWIDSQDGWDVGTDSASPATSSPAVTAGSTTTVDLSYDQEATVTAQYSLSQGTVPAGLNLPLSFYNAAMTTNPFVAEGSPAAVYPYSTSPSYYVIAGSCGTESDPDDTTEPGSADGQPVTLVEGGSTTVTIPLTPIAVAVTKGGSAVSGATVTAAVPSGDTNCPAAGSPTAMPTINLGTTSAALASVHRGPARRVVLTGWGTGSGNCPANVSLTTTVNPSASGQSVTFSTTVTNASTSGSCYYFHGTPTGNVSFYSGTTLLGTKTLNSSGTASLSTSSLSIGSHTISAVYSGDTNFATATSSSLTQVVNATGTTTTSTSTTTTTPTTTTTTTLPAGTVGVQSGLPYGKFILTATYISGANTYTGTATVVVEPSGIYLNGSSTPLASGAIIQVAVS